MIALAEHEICNGCGSCAQVCPRNCINMNSDSEGFLYPQINSRECIECCLCQKSCPVINLSSIKNNQPLIALKGRSVTDDYNNLSASGAILPEIARSVLVKGGIVFGARFNENFEVIHDFADSLENLVPLLGTKYVQSNTGESFRHVRNFLAEGRLVLFIGTPCQVIGLQMFLKKDYYNLITVDLICKAVPSPGVWEKYLAELCVEHGIDKSEILGINFRDKSKGWENYSFRLESKTRCIIESRKDNAYMKGFLSGLFTRPSCGTCSLKRNFRSDIRIGDAWGFDASEQDKLKGLSLIIANTAKGKELISRLNLEKEIVELSDIEKNNPACIRSFKINDKRDLFFSEPHASVSNLVQKLLHKSIFKKLTNRIKRIF